MIDLSGVRPPASESSFAPTCVVRDADFRRVSALPVYEWDKDPALPAYRDALTAALKTPNGTETLRLEQAAALQAIQHLGGAVLPLLPGAGKTLIASLAPWMRARKRPLLVVPGALHKRPLRRSKTWKQMQHDAANWRVHPLTVLTYQELGRETGDAKLAKIAPDMIILDEAHHCKNSRSGCWRKIARWVDAHDEGTIDLVVMSASLCNRGVHDAWHMITRALRDGAPVPRDLRSLLGWHLALDEKVSEPARLDPSPLIGLVPDAEGDDVLTRARNAYGKRLTRTFGVVASVAKRPAMALNITLQPLTAEAPLRATYERMHRLLETPDELPLDFAIEVYTKSLQLEQGFYYSPNPAPPMRYKLARREWSKIVREVLRTRHRFDTPAQVQRFVREGGMGRAALQTLEAWEREESSFRYDNFPVWLDDQMLVAAATWLRRDAGHTGIVWVDYPEVGAALARLSGLPFFWAGGFTTDRSQHIETCKTSCIASIATCGTGINIQHHYDRNLFLGWSSVGGECEQVLGRTHRDGQRSDEVLVTVVGQFPCKASAVHQSWLDAANIEQQTRVPQKLRYATYTDYTVTEFVQVLDPDIFDKE